MPMTKEERKEYDKQYRIKNKEKKKEYHKQYYLTNKEKLSQQLKEYSIKNKEKIKEYRKSEKYKKSKRISDWKQYGILCFDYNLLYDIFLSTIRCEFCDCELTDGLSSNSRCLDHDHSINDRFNVRGVLCRSCNIKDVLIKPA